MKARTHLKTRRDIDVDDGFVERLWASMQYGLECLRLSPGQ